MDERLDIVAFGASGFTGKHALFYLHKLTKKYSSSLVWGIAGRSETKLKSAIIETEKKIGSSLSSIPIIIADIMDEKSLENMTRRAKLIMNFCGPYSLYGEPVIKACIKTGTHYVDITGEPQFMERMELEYYEAAKEKGIYVVSACGMDSIPGDVGIAFLAKHFEGTLNSVETYLKPIIPDNVPGPHIHFGTWESFVLAIGNFFEILAVRKKLMTLSFRDFKPKLKIRRMIHKTDVVTGWCVNLPEGDISSMRRSQQYFYKYKNKRPIQIATYASVESFFNLLLISFFGLIFIVLSQFKFGQNLLLKYPSIFSNNWISREGPSEETQEKFVFALTFYGEGWSDKLPNPLDQYKTPPNKAIVARLVGTNPGYGITNISIVLAAIVILTEPSKLPEKGGVYSPGAAFAETTLMNKLSDNGVPFEILSVKNI